MQGIYYINMGQEIPTTNTNEENKPQFPSITPETIKDKNALMEFIPLAEMVARKEIGSMPSHLADFRELVNIGLIKINELIDDSFKKGQIYKPSYIIQGIRWDFKNKKRKDSSQRGEFRRTVTTTIESVDDGQFNLLEIQEAVISSVMAIDDEDMSDLADGNAVDPEENAMLLEFKKYLHEAIALLPDNYRRVIELRFYKGLKGVEIARMLDISSARVTRIIQDAVKQMQTYFSEKKLL